MAPDDRGALWKGPRNQLFRNAGDRRQQEMRSFEPSLLILSVGLSIAAIFKLYFTGHMEITLAAGDTFSYVGPADDGYWGAASVPGRPAMPSLFMALSELTGTRFRVLNELLFTGSTILAVAALRNAGINAGVAFLAALMILFAPLMQYHLDMAMADGIQIGLGMLLFALSLELLLAIRLSQRIVMAVLAGTVAAIMLHTRTEGMLIAAFLAPIAIVAIFEASRSSGLFTSTVALLFALVAPSLALNMGISALNERAFGYDAPISLLTRAETRLMSAFMRIDGGRSGKYVPITKDAREAAYAASPLLAADREVVESKLMLEHAEQYTGIPGALDTQRYIGILKALGARGLETLPAGHSLQDRVAAHEAQLDRISMELEAAFADGRLPERRIIHPFIDPVWREWAPLLPQSMAKVAMLLLAAPQPWLDNYGYGFSLDEKQKHDRVLNRDERLLKKGPMRGQLTSEGSEITSAWLILPGQIFGDVNDGTYQRLAEITLTPQGEAVIVESPVLDERWWIGALGMEVNFEDGSQSVSAQLMKGTARFVPAKNGASAWQYRIDEFPLVLSAEQRAMYDIWLFLSAHWPWFLGGFAVLSLAFAYAWPAHEDTVSELAIYAALAACLSALAARIGYYGIIDATAWHADMRYMVPGYPLLILALALASHFIGRARIAFRKQETA
ncbi:hypothetical protein ACKTEK_03695 [Tepidamorphus sp. 3E244]|uniref:hypothetical protein n=1 Tax=Tepidamorphus sp. 3E244 TaxID=3385498 RepID=UPI0038FC384B